MSATYASSMHTTLSQVLSRWLCYEGNDGAACNHHSNGTDGTTSRTVLVLDSLETDGRFVLGTLVSSLLSRPDRGKTTAAPQQQQHQYRILWLNCTTMTNQLTLAALQKFGCPKSVTSTAHLPESSSSLSLLEQSMADSALTMRSVPAMVRRMMIDPDIKQGNETIHLESIVRLLYRQVKMWLDSADKGQKWVILDDASTLAVLVGERLAYGLILSLRALSGHHAAFRLVIRASNDNDIERASLVDPRSTHWFGGSMDDANDDDDECPWERQLVEMADTIVDVVPLASGYSREVHGRLIFTSKAALPTTIKQQQDLYNYCLTDNQALVIRVVR